MTVIAVLNPKGGTGKTTVTLNLGLLLAARELAVSFVDLDPQKSLSDWIRRRPAALQPVNCVAGDAAEIRLAAAKHREYVLLDCPAGLSGKPLWNVIEQSQVVLIPVTLSRIDMDALTHFYFQLAAQDEKLVKSRAFAMIANRSREKTSVHASLLSLMSRFAIPLLATLRDTQNYTITAGNGMGIADLPGHRVKQDLASWQKIVEWVTDPC